MKAKLSDVAARAGVSWQDIFLNEKEKFSKIYAAIIHEKNNKFGI